MHSSDVFNFVYLVFKVLQCLAQCTHFLTVLSHTVHTYLAVCAGSRMSGCVAVVGAGISGLVCAARLGQLGVSDVTVFDTGTVISLPHYFSVFVLLANNLCSEK